MTAFSLRLISHDAHDAHDAPTSHVTLRICRPSRERSAGRLLRCLVGVIATLLVTAAPSPAHASEPSPDDRATARRLMKEGRQRRDANDLRGALADFEAADAIMHVATTQLEVAKAQVALGHLASAQAILLRVARAPAAPDEPKPFARARDSAKQMSDALQSRIPTLRVVLRGLIDSDISDIELDGRPAPGLREASTVDPGHHVVVVRARGTLHRFEVDVIEGEAKDVAITEGPDPSVARSAPGISANLVSADSSPDPHPISPHDDRPPTQARRKGESPDPQRIVEVSGFAVAGAGLVTGSIAGLMSIGFTQTLKRSCVNNVCPPSAYAVLSSAHSAATVANVGFAVSALGAAVGIGAFVFPTTAARAAQSPIRLQIGIGSADLTGSF